MVAVTHTRLVSGNRRRNASYLRHRPDYRNIVGLTDTVFRAGGLTRSSGTYPTVLRVVTE